MVLGKQGMISGLVNGYKPNTQITDGIAGTGVTTVTYSAAGAIGDADTVVTITGARAMTLAQPEPGRLLIIRQGDANTSTVTCTVGTFNKTNAIATFNAANETLVLLGVSSERWLILANIGAVALS